MKERKPRMLGETQLALLRRAAASNEKMIVVDWRNNVEVCAMKRLRKRGLMIKKTFGDAHIGFISVYTITRQGMMWVRGVDKPNES